MTDLSWRCAVPSGYLGHEAELWLLRVVPVPGSETAVVFITPYVVLSPCVADWLAFLDRILPKISAEKDRWGAYEQLMKVGLTRSYWNEYIFEAYVDHRPEVIFLAGLPDVEESRPHSRINSDS